jgi:hypothetical protein
MKNVGLGKQTMYLGNADPEQNKLILRNFKTS